MLASPLVPVAQAEGLSQQRPLGGQPPGLASPLPDGRLLGMPESLTSPKPRANRTTARAMLPPARACLTAGAVGSGGWQLLDVGGRVVRRHELTDQAWAEIAPLLPATGRPGGQWADHRRVVNGILWKLATGVPWRDLPERYGPWQTCYERFRRWQADGTWERLLAHAQTRSDAVGEVDWEVVVDATIVRAHQHAAGARKGDPAPT